MNRLASHAATAFLAASFALGGTAAVAATAPTTTAPAAPTTATAPATSGASNSAQAPATGNAMQAPTMAQQSIQQITQERLNNLRQQLKITTAEQPAWNKFEKTSMQNATNLQKLYQQRAQKVSSENAVQNLQSFAKIQKDQANDMQRLVPEFKTLYSKLTPQQQKIADQTFREHAERAQARFSQRMQSNLSSGQMQSSAATQSKLSLGQKQSSSPTQSKLSLGHTQSSTPTQSKKG
jgi:hypothetical protein